MINHCPRCEGAPALGDGDLKGVAVQLCNGCRGILMTRTDLDAIVALVGRKADLDPKQQVDDYFSRIKDAPEFVKRETSMHCPSCRYNMYEVESHGIVVDFCLNCQGLWFDEGELHRTLAEAREHGAIELVPSDVSGNETAQVICFMLDNLTSTK